MIVLFKRFTVYGIALLLIGGFWLTGSNLQTALAQVDPNTDPTTAERPEGLTINTDAVQPGYILFPVLQSTKTLLLSTDGRIVKAWDGDYYSAYSPYLQADGTLVRAVALPERSFTPDGPWSYIGGRVEVLNWAGEVIAFADYASESYVGHHDIEVLPNGNVLILAYERHLEAEVLAAGLDPALLPEDRQIWDEKIVEIDLETGEVVWEWRVWDHLVQEYDSSLPNYGIVAENPGKINLNYVEVDVTSDWLHGNTVEYNAARDEIMLSMKNPSEIWIIDHSITTEEAKGEAGDLLFRWGNPEAHGVGTDADQILYGQHDPQWIPDGYPGAGNITIFDNGSTEERPYSRIVEITPPLDVNGDYIMLPGQPTEPTTFAWEYVADPAEDFFSAFISGAQRQPNGNTLIAEGMTGRIFEVNSAGEIVWEYYLPDAAMPFKAEKYDLSAFGGFDEGQDLSEELGFYVRWGKACQDGTQPRLRAYLQNEYDDMQLFIATHGEDAQAEWEAEACQAHEGIASST